MTEDQRFIEYGVAHRPPRWWRVNWKRVALVAAVLTLATAVYYPYSPAGRQAANMRAAEALLPPIRQALQADGRFGGIRLGVSTARGGSITVIGAVASEDDRVALRDLIATSSIPQPVAWAVVVSAGPPAATQPTSTRPAK